MTFRASPYDVVDASQRVWLEHWDPQSASGNAVFTAILRSHQMLMASVNEVMKAHGLTFARYEVLAWLAAEPRSALTLSWISEVLRIPPATVTNLVDRLVTDGLILRVPHPTDARTTLAQLTPRGRKLFHAATDDLNAEVYRPLALSEARRGDLVEVLRELRANAGEFDTERSSERISRLAARGGGEPADGDSVGREPAGGEPAG
ncbi:MAG: MarR family winged helix-turn-helix transcriptional regulator [Microthrixaceae bacterium]